MHPLDGRRIWLVGIGGAGLSAYALLAQAWGAEVGGWDRNETPYLGPVRTAGIEVRGLAGAGGAGRAGRCSSPAPIPASPADRGRSCSPSSSLPAPAIVVAGAHGKTTTAAMIAFALRETGRDPSWIVGGEVPQLGANAGAGEGWLVVEGDESDRSVCALRPRVAVRAQRRPRPPHRVRLPCRGGGAVRRLAGGGAGGRARLGARAARLGARRARRAQPPERGRCGRRALELAGVPRAEAVAALASFRGRRATVRARRRAAAGMDVYDDYAHNPEKLRAALATARGAERSGRVLVLFQPHLYSRTLHSRSSSAGALASADVVAVTRRLPGARAAARRRHRQARGRRVVRRAARVRAGLDATAGGRRPFPRPPRTARATSC